MEETLEFVVDTESLPEVRKALAPLAMGALEINPVGGNPTKKTITITTEQPGAVHDHANKFGLSARKVPT